MRLKTAAAPRFIFSVPRFPVSRIFPLSYPSADESPNPGRVILSGNKRPYLPADRKSSRSGLFSSYKKAARKGPPAI